MTPDGFAGAAFLQAPDSTNDHDLGLFELGPAAGPSPAGRTSVGLYHLAWEVDTLETLERTAPRAGQGRRAGRHSDHGTTKSLYGKDPDGLEFEVVWIVPADQQTDDAARGPQAHRPARPGQGEGALRRPRPAAAWASPTSPVSSRMSLMTQALVGQDGHEPLSGAGAHQLYLRASVIVAGRRGPVPGRRRPARADS